MMLASQKSNSRAFLLERYKALQIYRTSTVSDPAKAEDRRHEVHLRTLIDAGDYDAAMKYVEDMTSFCESMQDRQSADMYREYARRIIEIRGHNGEDKVEEAVAGFYDLPG